MSTLRRLFVNLGANGGNRSVVLVFVLILLYSPAARWKCIGAHLAAGWSRALAQRVAPRQPTAEAGNRGSRKRACAVESASYRIWYTTSFPSSLHGSEAGSRRAASSRAAALVARVVESG